MMAGLYSQLIRRDKDLIDTETLFAQWVTLYALNKVSDNRPLFYEMAEMMVGLSTIQLSHGGKVRKADQQTMPHLNCVHPSFESC